MGTCASSTVNKESDSSKMMKLRLVFWPKSDNLVISSPLKVNGDRPIAPQPGLRSHSHSFPDLGSKEDTFFDSQPWLESDCDDDFFSVKGDFTPSRGNTPVHHKFSIGSPGVSRNPFNEPTPEPSPNKKKRLSELFQESQREHRDDVDDLKTSTTILGLPPKPLNGATTPLSSARTSHSGEYKAQKEKMMKSVQCCLPKMLPSRSFNEKYKMSPAHVIG